MAKATYACVECGYRTPKPLGRCPSCGSWESFQEVAPAPASRRAKPSPLPLLALSQVDEADKIAMPFVLVATASPTSIDGELTEGRERVRGVARPPRAATGAERAPGPTPPARP